MTWRGRGTLVHGDLEGGRGKRRAGQPLRAVSWARTVRLCGKQKELDVGDVYTRDSTAKYPYIPKDGRFSVHEVTCGDTGALEALEEICIFIFIAHLTYRYPPGHKLEDLRQKQCHVPLLSR